MKVDSAWKSASFTAMTTYFDVFDVSAIKKREKLFVH